MIHKKINYASACSAMTILGLILAVGASTGCGKKRGPDSKAQPKTQYVTIGTGGVTGVYYPVGGALSKIINQQTDIHRIKASVESTGGSVYNINAVVSGDLELGLAQSDRQFQAVNGMAEWLGRPQTNLRALFSLHPEIVTLVATDASKIYSLQDLKYKRVNIGNPGSGHRHNAMEVLNAAGIDMKTEIRAESLKASEAPKMLQDGRLDAFFYTVGHPNGAIKEATSGKRKVHLVPIAGMENLIQRFPYYTVTEIPKGMYPQASNDKATPSIGVVTTVIASADLSDETVYDIVSEVFDNLDTLRALHPALENLKASDMLNGLRAPLHPGAERYFTEKGLL